MGSLRKEPTDVAKLRFEMLEEGEVDGVDVGRSVVPIEKKEEERQPVFS